MGKKACIDYNFLVSVLLLVIILFLFLVVSLFLFSYYQDGQKAKCCMAMYMYQDILKEAGNGSKVKFDFEGIHLEVNPFLKGGCKENKKKADSLK